MYEAGGYQFAIAQAEVTDLLQLDEHLRSPGQSAGRLREQRGLDFAMLMVTDVVGGSSRLLLVNEPPVLSDLPYPRQPDGTRLAEGVVSRKKAASTGCAGFIGGLEMPVMKSIYQALAEVEQENELAALCTVVRSRARRRARPAARCWSTPMAACSAPSAAARWKTV